MNAVSPIASPRARQLNTDNMIFVFGSNLQGLHGGGAARWAMNHRGARWGTGIGRTGQAYALPTKRTPTMDGTLPLEAIKAFVDNFLDYARETTHQQFQVTCVGCGLAGLKHEDIAPMFKNAPANCHFDTLWQPWLGNDKSYWGTF